MTDRRTFAGIQLLRGFAATLVVCDHTASGLADTSALGHQAFRFTPLLFAGNGGVDLFFVISGFVIVWTTQGKWWQDHAWRVFLGRRVRRIFPLYWIIITAKLAVMMSLPHLFRATRPTDWNIAASYLLVPTWAPQGPIGLILASGWTLCFEMAFYYICATCLALRRPPMRFVAPLLVVIALIGICRTPQWGAAGALIDPMLLEFVAGMAIAELTLAGMVRKDRWLLVAVLGFGVVLFLATGLLPDAISYNYRTLTWGIPAALIVYAVVGLEFSVNFKRLTTMLVVGDASYSIYLTHGLFLQPLVMKAKQIALPPSGEWLVLVLLIAAAIGFGVLVWWTLERRLEDFWRRRSSVRALSP